MCFRIVKHGTVRLALAGVLFFGLTPLAAHAQFRLFRWLNRDCCPPEPCITSPAPVTPGTPSVPDTKKEPTAPAVEPTLSPIASAAGADNMMAYGPGYLDNAVPFSHFRLRFDAAYRNNRPDRAEFFYAKCGCFGGNAPGPPLSETSVDYQDLSAYLEYATSDRLSFFIEFPFRFLNPQVNNNTAGLADMNTGFKYALIHDDCRYLTFQGRIYLPTGDSDRGLGTNNVNLEPSLLYSQTLSDRLTVFGQFGDWIPIGGTDFAGNVLRYGAGLSYAAFDNGRFRAAPVVELLGWTVLGGKEAAFPENVVRDAAGDTIINAKIGVRFGFGPDSRSDFYIGYGRALTGEVWYKDILRLEYQMRY